MYVGAFGLDAVDFVVRIPPGAFGFNRRAALVSTLVAVRSADDPEPLIACGRVPGEIAREPVGSNGFGFDPVMFIPEFGQTFAQLPVDVKNANSHRGRATRQMMALMRERWL